LIEINAINEIECKLEPHRESKMAISDFALLTLIVGAFTLFGGVLAWASWDETHRKGRRPHQ
jgi:hypothetical protein